jgi:hypothetical protein
MGLKEKAQAAGEMFFTGRVCKKHPELAGRRRAKSGGCPSCIRERAAKRRKKTGKAEYNRKRRLRRAAIKAGVIVPRKYRKANEKAANASAGG